VTALLANLLNNNNEALRELAKYMVKKGPGSPGMLVLLLGVIVMSATAVYMWRWLLRRQREPNSRALLRMAACEIGLSKDHCQLLWRLGQTGGVEPAIALVSPRLMVHLVDRSEKAGLHLNTQQVAKLGQILDAVTAAACQDRKHK